MISRAARAVMAASFATLTFPAAANPINLVANGSFESTVGTCGGKLCNSAQMTNSNLANWATTSGYTFVVFPGQATVNLGNGIKLFGGSSFPATSPDGGNFLVSDGGYQTGAETQTINGLVAGQSYVLNFY
jgi:hypothetical protein